MGQRKLRRYEKRKGGAKCKTVRGEIEAKKRKNKKEGSKERGEKEKVKH